MVLGFVVTGLVFSDPTVDTKAGLNSIIWYSNVAISVIFVFVVLTLREKPTHPPTAVSAHEPPKQNILALFAELKSNRNFWFICIANMLAQAPLVTFQALASLVYIPFGMTVGQISIYGISASLTGGLASVIFGLSLDRTRLYKLSLVVSGFLIALMIACQQQALPIADQYFQVIVFISMVYMAATNSSLVVCNNFAVEVTYPISGPMVIALLMLGSQLSQASFGLFSVRYLSIDLSGGVITPELL
jgi:hypothetical protein